MNTVYLSLGSNLGDREQNIARAIEVMSERGVLIVGKSSLYETEPVDVSGDGGWFLNSAVEVATELGPCELMNMLLGVERDLGRKRWAVSGPKQDGPKQSRTIDIDILLYGDRLVNTPEVEIPHPRMTERRFVLVPLAEIAPRAIHPARNKSIAQILEESTDIASVKRREPK